MPFQPHFDLISALVLFGVLQAALLAWLFLNKGLHSSSFYLGIIMLVLAVVEIESFLKYTGYMIHVPHLLNISPPLIFLLGPSVFFYMRSSVSPQEKMRKPWIHFLPACLYFLYSIFFYLQPAAFKISAFIRSAHPESLYERVKPLFPTDPLHIQGWIVIEGLALHLLLYVVISLIPVFSNRISSKTSHSGNGKSLAWIRFLGCHLFIGSVIFLLTGGIVNGTVLFKSLLPPEAVDLYSTFLVYSVSVYWLSKLVLPEVTRKYAKSALPSELRHQRINLIREIMEKEKPYKDSNFCLESLATKTSMSCHHLSQVINADMGMTFNELINLYRINEAQEMLKAPGHKDLKVESLAQSLGYQSKSAFFNAFKRQTLMTPARFRELQ